MPDDRPIDGVDQLDFLLHPDRKSKREGFVYCIKNELRAVKWRNWKMHIVWDWAGSHLPVSQTQSEWAETTYWSFTASYEGAREVRCVGY